MSDRDEDAVMAPTTDQDAETQALLGADGQMMESQDAEMRPPSSGCEMVGRLKREKFC